MHRSGLGLSVPNSAGQYGMPVGLFGQVDCSNPVEWLMYPACWAQSPAAWTRQLHDVPAPPAPASPEPPTAAQLASIPADQLPGTLVEEAALQTQEDLQQFYSNLADTICNGRPANADGSCPSLGGTAWPIWMWAAIAAATVGVVVLVSRGGR